MKIFIRSMDRPSMVCLAIVLLASAASLSAQEGEEEAAAKAAELEVEPAPTEAVPAICEAEPARIIILPKLTPVYVSVDATLGSKLSTSGETFPITVTEPVLMDGIELIPVGTSGEGEVIHAKKAGASGSGGELILTANFIELGGRRIPLRSMKLGLTGKDQGGLAMATGIFAGPVGFLVRGKNIDVAEGTPAGAKLAEDTEFERPAEAAGGTDNCTDNQGMEGTPE